LYKIKFITYFNNPKFKFNTIHVNNILQDLFNPSNGIDNIQSNNKYEVDTIFRIQDKIIRVENDYSSEKMRANGEEAEIMNYDGRVVTIKYVNDADTIPETITIDELYENFKLNYCITIHKSQGSQFDNVVLFIEPNQTIIDKTSLYTAISRARNKCIVVSSREDFIKCQMNNNSFDNKVSLFMRKSNNYDL
jgi:exodeoxyribonuclease V alpha subunit